MGKIFGVLGRIWVACRIILAHLGRKTAAARQVEAISEDRGRILAPTWPILAPSWSILAPTWAILTPSWNILAPTWVILEHLGANMSHLGPILEHLGRVLAPTWTILATILVAFWDLWSHLEVEVALEPRRCKKHCKTYGETTILETCSALEWEARNS